MSDHLPIEIVLAILKLLPIKSLIQFRSVSKSWKTVIDSPDFIADYTIHNHAQPQHLFVRYENPYSETVYVSIADNDSFPQNKVFHTVPRSVNLLRDKTVIVTSDGLVCIFGYYRNSGVVTYESRTQMAVLWNPSIRKSAAVVVPPDVDVLHGARLGFGVCPATIDPKIVTIRYREGVTWPVKVFSLRSGVWRILSGIRFDKLVDFKYPCSPVTIDGLIYWFGVGDNFLLIVSFDLSNEVFREICLPNQLALAYDEFVDLFIFNRSLAVVKIQLENDIHEVWMVENGEFKSFTKVFNVSVGGPYVFSVPLGFRKNGELMMRFTDSTIGSDTLLACEPFSNHIDDLEIEAQCYTIFVSSYMESLLLLDQSDTFDGDEDDDDENDDGWEDEEMSV